MLANWARNAAVKRFFREQVFLSLLLVRQGATSELRRTAISLYDGDSDDKPFIAEALALKSRLLEKSVPGDVDCFYHCMNYHISQGSQAWRKAIATELKQHRYYYEPFFTDTTAFLQHVRGVLGRAWADNHDIMAAAWILRKPIVIFRKGSDQEPTAVVPASEVWHAPMFLMLLSDFLTLAFAALPSCAFDIYSVSLFFLC